MQLLIVTGLSGAGRRSVLSALEDVGFTALDNVPIKLLEDLVALEVKLHQEALRLAVGMDNRHLGFAEEFPALLKTLAHKGVQPLVVFVEAREEVLLRRFSETRRPHFLAKDGSVVEGVHRERELLAPLRELASTVIDTSDLSLTQLRRRVADLLPGSAPLDTQVRLVSFGFKRGVPQDADVVLDARFLPNPYYVAELRGLTGMDRPVRDFVEKDANARIFLERAEAWMRWSLPLVRQEGRAYYTLAIGCTGGQHRSVALIEALAERLAEKMPTLHVQHRELGGL